MLLKKLRRTIILAVLFVSVAMSGQARAQSVAIILAPNLSVAQVVYISDFDFLQTGSSIWLFSLVFTNPAETSVKLEFKVIKDGDEIASAESDYFLLPVVNNLSITNIELTNGFTFSNGATVRFENTNVNNPSGDFQDEVLGSGQLPRGNYIMSARLIRQVDNSEYGSSQPASVSVLNPTYIDLVEPGNQAGSSNPVSINNEFPLFQFNTDYQESSASLGAPYHLRVYKKLPEHSSVDEVLTTSPQLDLEIATNSFQYPTANAQPLENGTTYFWQVSIDFPTSNGSDELLSPVYQFKYENTLDDPGDGDKQQASNSVIELLRALVGNRADQIASDLENYNLTGIRVNNELISTQQLYQIIDSYEGKTVEISDLLLQSQ